MGEALSDSQRCLVHFDMPFHSSEDGSGGQDEVDLLEMQSQINDLAVSESNTESEAPEETKSSVDDIQRSIMQAE